MSVGQGLARRTASTSTPSPTVAPPPTARAVGGRPGSRSACWRPGTYTFAPFTSPESEPVPRADPAGMRRRRPRGDSLRFTVTTPAGWAGSIGGSVDRHGEPGARTGPHWASVGAPGCSPIPARPLPGHPGRAHRRRLRRRGRGPPDPRHDDARRRHLGGYPGKYFDLQGPADVSTEAEYIPDCVTYRPWDPGIYMQGPSHRWRLWVLDVDGVAGRGPEHGYPGHLGRASRRAPGDGGLDARSNPDAGRSRRPDPVERPDAGLVDPGEPTACPDRLDRRSPASRPAHWPSIAAASMTR